MSIFCFSSKLIPIGNARLTSLRVTQRLYCLWQEEREERAGEGPTDSLLHLFLNKQPIDEFTIY